MRTGDARAAAASVRPAEPRDVPVIVAMVAELATYEKAAGQAQMSEAALQEALFGAAPALYAHVAVLDGEPVGFAVWFLNFSTWRGRHGIYLEDLYVRPEHRGTGLGTALLGTLAGLCVARGYARLEWWVLDWNTPAIDFYRSVGAVAMDEWTVFRLTGPALERLGRHGHTEPLAGLNDRSTPPASTP